MTDTTLHGHPSLGDAWRRHFDDRAEWNIDEAQTSGWSSQGLGTRVSLLEDLLPHLALTPGCAMLDLGCGAGTYVSLLARRGCRVTAIDYAVRMIGRARATHANAEYVAADGQYAPFRSESFDFVLCIGVLPCCETPRRLIHEAARLLRPGGSLLIEAFNPLHFTVPVIKLLELVGARRRSDLMRHSTRAVERYLNGAGIEIDGRVPLYVSPSRSLGRLIVTTCGRLPGLWRLGATAVWWHGRKRGGSTPSPA